MEGGRFQRLAGLFEQARSLAADAREALLDQACAGDAVLRDEVERLLAHHDTAESTRRVDLLDAASALRDELGLTVGGLEPAEPGDQPLPESVGRYRIRGEIARGGFGVVLRGEDATIGRDVAVKILPLGDADSPAMADLLCAEGRIGGRLQHPGIVPVYELGEADGGRPFLAMKVVEGRTLASLLRERTDPASDRVRFLGIFEQVCQAVAYAHARSVIHRDLKPQNLMVGEFGEVQVMDWGLAEEFDADRARVDERVPVIGTPAYMAPEQARGERGALDPRGDVFGLGAILCEILTGAPPFTGMGTGTVLEQAREGNLTGAEARVKACGADPELIVLALRCLARDSAARPADAREVAGEVRAFLDSLDERARAAELAAASARARASSERRARRMTTALGVVVVLTTLVGAAAWLGLENAAANRQRVAGQRLRSALLDVERVASDAAASNPETSTRWAAAAAAARTAERLVVEDAAPELRQEVEARIGQIAARLRDVRFVERMEAIALEDRFLSAFDRRGELAEHRAALEAYLGADLDAIPVGDVRTSLAAFAYPDRLLRALDSWALTEYQVDHGSPRMKWIRALANSLDPDPWRAEVRGAAGRGDLEQLAVLARSEGTARASAGALLSLGLELFIAGRDAAALAVFEQAHDRFPGDFEINLNLAFLHMDGNRHGQALPFATAAMVLRPQAAMTHAFVAGALAGLERVDEAVRRARRAVELAPEEFGPCTLAANILLDAGEVAEAGEIVERFCDTTPTNHAVFVSLASIMAGVRLAQGDADQAIGWFLAEVNSPRVDLLSPRWQRCAPQAVSALRPGLEQRVRASDDRGPAELYLLARLDEHDGRWRDALRRLEQIEGLRPGFAQTRAHILRLRSGLGRELATHATVDAAIRRLDREVDYAEARAALLGERWEDSPDPGGLRAYAEGRLLVRWGRPAEAIEWFERALAADREASANWTALHAAWAAREGHLRADLEIRELLGGGPLPRAVLEVPPAPPTPVAPEVGAEIAAPFALRVTGFDVADARRRHGWTRWQVRAVDADYERHPALDLVIPEGLETVVPPGLLESGRSYAWRAAFVTDDPSVASPWSEEAGFQVAVGGGRAVPLDLTKWLNSDVIANPGDPTGDPFDPPNSYQLVVEGFDGVRTDAGEVQGVPADGRVGVHRLASFDGPNSIALDHRREAPLRIPVPPGRYLSLLALVAGGNGDVVFRAGLLYEDGTMQPTRIGASDWFSAGIADQLGPGSMGVPVLRRMDRMGPEGAEERNAATLFEVLLPCDPDRRVVALVIEPARSLFDGPETTGHVLALTAMALEGRERGR